MHAPSTTDRPSPVLEVDSLGFAYGERFRLDPVSFAVDAGRFTALLGVNGAGKTTLFALITRLFDSHGGHVRVGGRDVRADPGRALAAMGVVFQQPTLDLDLTVQQNLDYFAALHGLAGRVAGLRIAAELERQELTERRRERVRSLSGGLRRRVELARALLHRPALLLLDEPTVGLDVPSRARIVDHVHALARDDGTAVLWATHLIDEVCASDHVVVLHRGRVLAGGPVEDVVRDAGVGDLGQAFARLTEPAAGGGR